MKIQNHRLVGVEYINSPNQSGVMDPNGAVMHFTAGSTSQSAIATFLNRSSRASAHLVIGPDADVTQMVPFNRKAWHAGPSRMAGRRGANHFTIGFEFVNPGFYRVKNGVIYDWSGKRRISQRELDQWSPRERHPSARVGSNDLLWPAFKPAQLDVGLEILELLRREYGLVHLAGHDEIDTRGWKTDPGPMFPWPRFRAVFGGPAPKPRPSPSPSPSSSPGKGYTHVVTAGRLNVRSGPNGRVLTQISRGTPVTISRTEGSWARIFFDGGRIGWVAREYLA